MAKKKKTEKNSELSFEHSFNELQEIVSRLENGRLTLGDALQDYENGMKRLQECYRALNEAESKIEKLSKLRADGTFEADEFETTSGKKKKNKPTSNEDDSALF